MIAPVLGEVAPATGLPVEVDKTFRTGSSVFYDALFIPGGQASVDALEDNGDAVHWIQEAFKHNKTIGANGDAIELVYQRELAARADEISSRWDLPASKWLRVLKPVE